MASVGSNAASWGVAGAIAAPRRRSDPDAAVRQRCGLSIPDDPVQMRPHAVERLGNDLRVTQCLVEQFRARPQNHLRDFECLGGVAFLDLLREALLEIRLVLEMREMDGQGIGERPHPVDRHHLDRAPRDRATGE